MSTTAKIATVPTARGMSARAVEGSIAFDWAMAGLGALLVGGLYLDIWAHNHGKVDQSFFTPWHAVLYSAFALGGVVLALVVLRNAGRGYRWQHALPPGYLVSLLGVAIFGVGGLLDMLWHLVFGIEASIEALLSPTHLVLALGAILIVAGPLRSAWRRYDPATIHGWAALGPLVVSAGLVVALLAAMTQYAHPFVDIVAVRTPDTARMLDEVYVMNADGSGQTRLTVDPRAWHGTPAWSPDGRRIVYTASGHPRLDVRMDSALGVASILVQSAILMGLVLLLVARWQLPIGALTVLLLITSALGSVLQDQYKLIPAAVVAGMIGDLLLRYLRPVAATARLRLFAFALPALLYTGYFATLARTEGIGWSVHMWTGAIALAGVTGLLLSFLVVPPRGVPSA